jgi:tRNA-(MS[2]IO[6]A)-hydroxylase (MiaE)-like
MKDGLNHRRRHRVWRLKEERPASVGADAHTLGFPVTETELQHDSQPAEGAVDLLGMLAYAALSSFFRLSDAAAAAESLPDKMALAEMAVVEYGHFRRLLRRLEELGADPDAAMQPFVQALDAFHARTRPADWLEELVKAYVGDGVSADFYRTVADLLDPQTQALVNEVLADTDHSEFVIARVREAIVADPPVAGRLVLWARRLVGEALGQVQRIAAEREALARLLGGGDSSQPGKIGRMFAKLTDAHSRRMAALGLARPERRGAASDAAAGPFRTIRSRAKRRRAQGELCAGSNHSGFFA